MQQQNIQKINRNIRLIAMRQKIKSMPVIHQTSDNIKSKLKNKTAKKQFLINQLQESSKSWASSSLFIPKSQKAMGFYEKYQLAQKIGQGAHGVVKKCIHKETGKVYCVKFVNTDDQHVYFLKRNFVNIQDLDHENIIKYKALYLDMKKQICILVMQYLNYPNLLQYEIKDQEELKLIVFQVILALSYIHSKFICHRDIKPQNILYDYANRKIKLIDFGISRKVYERNSKKQMLTLTGTPFYRAPQMFLGGGYDQKVDLWALGVTIYKLITKTTPFQSQYHSDTIQNILKGQVVYENKMWYKYSHLVKDLVNHLLKPKQSRLTIEQAKNHFWFYELNQNQIKEQQQFAEQQQTMSKSGLSELTLFSRTITDNTQIRNRNSSHHFTAKHIFNKQQYQKQAKLLKWIKDIDGQQMDLIQSQQQDSSMSPIKAKSKKKNYPIE